MARNVDLNAASATPHEQPASPEVKLARELKVPLQNFSEELKNLTPMSARSDPSLSKISETIIQLYDIAKRAAKIE